MKTYSLVKIAELLQAHHYGPDVNFSNVSIDTRTLDLPDTLYVAIKGDNFDGHNFINAAYEKGAVAVLSEIPLNVSKPYLLVTNCRKALGQLAAFHRKMLNKYVIGLTGSMGKTTTKAMLAAILRQQYQVLAPVASMNNDIGLPLTLLQLNSKHDYAVLEMGTNHFGEIAYLTQIAAPDMAMITNIGPVHLEYLGDLNGVVKAKAEIFSGLTSGGKVILNRDDQFYETLRSYVKNHQVYTFGLSADADVRAENIQLNAAGEAEFDLLLMNQKIKVKLNILGMHNVMNALAAATCSYIAGANSAAIKTGLEQMRPVAKRLCVTTGLLGAIIIDDSYSANPKAVNGALEILAHYKGTKIFVFGGMGELAVGMIQQHHADIGNKAKALGIDYLLAVNEHTKATVASFGENGFHFATKMELIQALKELLQDDSTVLIKGSRSTKMEEVVEAIQKPESRIQK